MLKKLTIISVLSASILTGCGKEAPKCSDKEVTNLVIKIVKESIMGLNPLIKGAEEITVVSIRTVEHNKETGAYTCKGKLNFIGKDKTQPPFTIPVTYTLENTDDGKEFYVSVVNFNE